MRAILGTLVSIATGIRSRMRVSVLVRSAVPVLGEKWFCSRQRTALEWGMAELDGFPLTNLLLYAAVALAPTFVFWAALIIFAHAQRRPRAREPQHPPIQALAADLRRVHRLLAEFGPGTPAARRNGTRQAYDALLIQACAAVEVEHELDTLPEGVDREVERLRVEHSLRTAGLAIP